MPAVDPKLWQLAVDDEFDSGKLDPAVWWAPYDGVPGIAGVGTRRGSLCTFRNGELVISAERPNANDTNYDDWFSTGVAMGPQAQTYGRREIEASASDGPGFWPNLQLWPTDEKWPINIEFDIFESPIGTRDVGYATVHYGSNNTQKSWTYKANFNAMNTWIVEVDSERHRGVLQRNQRCNCAQGTDAYDASPLRRSDGHGLMGGQADEQGPDPYGDDPGPRGAVEVRRLKP